MFINNLKTVFDNKLFFKTLGELWESKETTKVNLIAPPKTNKLTKINIYPAPNPKRNGCCRKPSRRPHKFPYQNEGEQSEQNYDLIKCNILPFFLPFYAITKTKI